MTYRLRPDDDIDGHEPPRLVGQLGEALGVRVGCVLRQLRQEIDGSDYPDLRDALSTTLP